MSSIASGIVAQQAVSQLNLATSLTKTAQKAEQAIVNMIAASVDQTRGQNLDVSV